jgi:hypothetical protein
LSLLTIVVPFTGAKVILSFVCSATYGDFFFVFRKKRLRGLRRLIASNRKKILLDAAKILLVATSRRMVRKKISEPYDNILKGCLWKNAHYVSFSP